MDDGGFLEEVAVALKNHSLLEGLVEKLERLGKVQH